MIDLAIAASTVCVNNFLLMTFLLPIDGLFNHQSASLRETSLLLTVLSALAETSLLFFPFLNRIKNIFQGITRVDLITSQDSLGFYMHHRRIVYSMSNYIL